MIEILNPPCHGQTDLFFYQEHGRGYGSKNKRKQKEAMAKAICDQCPFIFACRELGRQGRESGIWGGETEAERALAGYMPKAMAPYSYKEVQQVRRMVNGGFI